MDDVIIFKKIQVELIKLLYQPLKFFLLAEACVAILVVCALWGVKNPYLLEGWLAYTLSVCVLGRFVLLFAYQYSIAKTGVSYSNMQFWLKLFFVGAILSGISWGIMGAFLVEKQDLLRLLIIIVLLLGIASASNPLYAPNRAVYHAFLLLSCSPFIIWLFLQGGLYILLGLLSIVYMVTMFLISTYSHKLHTTSLFLRFKNMDLLNNILSANDSLENRSAQLEKTLSIVRATLESTNDGILVINVDNKIENINQKFIDEWNISKPMIDKKNLNDIKRFLASQLLNPMMFVEKFAKKINQQEEVYIELNLKDGRTMEYYSHPLRLMNKSLGCVCAFRNITRYKVLEARLFHQANYDALTELPNRVLASDRISQAIGFSRIAKQTLAVLFMDIDRFKYVNDTLGHALGDRLLIEVAHRLLQLIREHDTVSRQSGDEFIIVLTYSVTEVEAIAIARKCLAEISKPYTIDGIKLNITASLGISLYPKDGQDAITLIKNADAAMYKAKELGRNNFQFYTEEMNQKLLNRLVIENRLKRALGSNEFSLNYQPIIHLDSQRIVAVEALLRWQHSDLGLMMPADFISIAEESGLMIDIGEWVLRKACADAKKLEARRGEPIQVSVNIANVQLKDATFADKVRNILHETQLAPCYLALEFIESAIMDDADNNINVLGELKKIGVTIIIDDFGMGYSSLNYLKRFPIDKLKIDTSFIHTIPVSKENSAIVSAIIAFAKQLHFKVVAEGVENDSQLKFLLAHHCDEIQGFYYKEPVDFATCSKILQENQTLSVPNV